MIDRIKKIFHYIEFLTIISNFQKYHIKFEFMKIYKFLFKIMIISSELIAFDDQTSEFVCRKAKNFIGSSSFKFY